MDKKYKTIAAAELFIITAAFESNIKFTQLISKISVGIIIMLFIVLASIVNFASKKSSASDKLIFENKNELHYNWSKVSLFAWIIIILLPIAWDLYSFIKEKPVDPTLSYLIGQITADIAGRFILFLLWLWLGYFLVFSRAR
jgi:hypothetical protein